MDYFIEADVERLYRKRARVLIKVQADSIDEATSLVERRADAGAYIPEVEAAFETAEYEEVN